MIAVSALAPGEPLLQEILVKASPWHMLVGCMLLNVTTRRQADEVWPTLFCRWPTPAALAHASRELEALLVPLGLRDRRGAALRRMSAEWCAGARPPEPLFGIGKYALDSWALFVEGRVPDDAPTDKELVAYVGRLAQHEQPVALDGVA